MDIFSVLPIIIMIIAVFSKLNKGTTKTNQRPRNPFTPSTAWPFDLETSLPKRLSGKSLIPTSEIVQDINSESEGIAGIEGTAGVEGTAGIEGTAGVEGTLKPILTSEINTPQSDKPIYCSDDLMNKNLAEAVIWAEILGKPKSRINKPLQRNF